MVRPLVFLSALFCLTPPSFGEEQRVDSLGDPLPAGATARFGSARFRPADASTFALAPDGKTLIVGEANGIGFWDMTTGLRRGWIGGDCVVTSITVSADGGRFAALGHERDLLIGEPLFESRYDKILFVGDVPGSKLFFTCPRGARFLCPRPANSQQTYFGHLAFSSDGATLAVQQTPDWPSPRGYELVVLDARTGEPLWRTGGTLFHAFSLDGAALAVEKLTGAGIDLVLLRPADGKELWHLASVFSHAFSPDRKTVAVSKPGGDVALLDVVSGRELRRLKIAARATDVLRFSPDGNILAVRQLPWWSGVPAEMLGPVDDYIRSWHSTRAERSVHLWWLPLHGDRDEESAVHLWDLTSGKKLCRLGGHTGAVATLQFTPDSRMLVTGDFNHRLFLWDVRTGRRACCFGTDGGAWISDYAISADGKALACHQGNRHPQINVWDLGTCKERRRWQADQAEIKRICFSAEARLVLCGGRTLMLYDSTTGAVHPSCAGHRTPIVNLEYSPDGRLLASVDDEGPLSLWTVADGTHRLLKGTKGGRRAHAIRFSADGKLLTDAPLNDDVCVWNTSDGTVRARFDVGKAGHLPCISRDGRSLFARLEEPGKLRLCNLTTGQYRDLSTHGGKAVMKLAESPDGTQLLTCGEDGRACVWDLREGKERDAWPVGQLRYPAFSGDCKRVAGMAEGRLGVWDCATGEQLWQVQVGESACEYVVFSGDGKLIAHQDEASIMCWEAATGRFLKRLPLPARFTEKSSRVWLFPVPDGRLLGQAWDNTAPGRPSITLDVTNGRQLLSHDDRIYPSPDGKVILATRHGLAFHDAQTGRALGRIGDFGSLPAFAPDERTLAAGCEDGSILFWDLSPLNGAWPPQLVSYADSQLAELWGHLSPMLRDHDRLLASPRQAVPLVAARLKDVRLPDPVRIARLIADLDSEQFEARASAARELMTIGKPAERALRKALAAEPSSEVKRSIQALIGEHQIGSRISPELRRAEGALRVLATIGNDDARNVLQQLARGPEGAWLTDEAAAALRRLAAANEP